jgi:hypothetical protein
MQNNSQGNWYVFSTVTVGNNNNSPVSSLPAVVKMQRDRNPASVFVPASDPDGDPVTFRLATSAEWGGSNSQPSGLAINSTTGELTWNTTGLSQGNLYNAAVIVADNKGGEVMIDFLIEITQQSTAPQFDYSVTPANGASFDISPGQTVSFTLKASDVDPSSTVKISGSGLPTGISVSPAFGTTNNPIQHSFSWTPTSSQNGQYVLNFIAEDNIGVQSSTSVNVNVSLKPTFDVPPTPAEGVHMVVDPDSTITYTVQASDPDPADVVRIRSVQGKNMMGNKIPLYNGATFSIDTTVSGNPVSGVFSWTPVASQWGHRHVFFTAVDTYGQTKIHEIDQLVNTPPVFTSASSKTVIVGQPFTHTITVADPDTAYGDHIDIMGISLLPWLTLVDNSDGTATLTGTAPSSASSTTIVNIQAEDMHHHEDTRGVILQNLILNVVSCNVSASISSQTNVSCNGGTDGSATVTATGGTSPYTYAWSNATTTANVTNLAAGTYTVTVSDANNCTATSSLSITEPTTLLSSVAIDSNVSCNGLSNGGLTASANGGTSPYTFAWSNSATTASITGLTAGTYSVTVSDANGCTSTANGTITEPTALAVASATNTNVTCNGGADGSATVTATGGTSPYTYAWSNTGTTASITGLTAGTYTATVTDANGCTTTTTATVTEPTALTATSSNTNVSCNGGADGSATVSATGGTSPYTYAWSNAGTTASITGLTAGTYTATVTDANGCTTTTTATVTEPIALSATASNTNVSCNGGADGSATVTATGGTSPYTYAWSNAGTTASITGLTAGTYTATVTDANGCTTTTTATVTEPTASSATSSNTNVSCNGGADGSATVTATGGTSPFTYAWSNSATTASITGLTAGTYTATVTDANGCTITATATVTEPTVPTSSSTVTACDSYTWVQNNMMYTASGAYTDTVQTSLGCDSIITLNLTINNSAITADTVTACDSYTWIHNSMMYTASGVYVDTVQTSLGCDSIVTLDLTINNSAMTADTVTACDSYTWMHNSMMYTASGVYVDTVQTSLGCDSIVTLDLTINNSAMTADTVTACDSYTWMHNSMMYTASGVYVDTVQTSLGCDSIITLNLTINNSAITADTVTACDSYTWMHNSMMYTASGVYVDTVQTSLGCDSIVTLDLTINNSAMTADTVTACDSYTWMHNSMMYTASGVYVDTVQTSLGCDSIVTLDLTIDTLDLTIAKFNDSLVVNDANATTYQWINCDSNNRIIPGATNAGFRPAFDGNYAVILTKGACVDTSACQNVVVNSIYENSKRTDFVIYPNPTNGQIFIQLEGFTPANSPIEVYSLTGQIVHTAVANSSKVTIDLSGMERGIYLVRLGQTMKKVVLTR